jgi:hypothetical protein
MQEEISSNLMRSKTARRGGRLGVQLGLVVSALSAAGCGNGAVPDEESAAVQPPDLAGRYVSACAPQPQADGSTSYFQLRFDLTATRWSIDYVVFGDEACATRVLTVNIEGPYALTAPSTVVDGAWEARFGFDQKTMTPHVPFMVDTLSSLDGCGTGTWTLDEPMDISGGCAAFGQQPVSQCSADYDLVMVDADGVRFGQRPADNNMCQPERRPAAISPLLNVRQ